MISPIFRSLVIIGAMTVLASCSPSPTPSPSPSPTPTSTPALPQDWTTYYDSALDMEISYPSQWQISPASGPQGEAAVTSFQTQETSDTGGVPQSELKVGVVRFGPDDPRQYQVDPDQVVQEESITVDGFPATKRTLEGPLGGSVSVEVPSVNEYTYVISAYPPDSELIGTFDQILDQINLSAQPPITVSSPTAGATVTSPLTVTGQAPGTWFFEGSFPVALVTAENTVLSQTAAATEEDWMTEEMIPFSATLTFNPQEALIGYLRFEKANPSGLPENAYTYTLPVRFEQ